MDVGRRHFGPVQPTGFRICHSRWESGALPETSLRHRNLPHLRVLPTDGVAVLEFPEFHEEVGNLTDHHTGFRIGHSRRESGALPETFLRHRNFPHLRVLPTDGVAVLEFPEFHEEVGNLTDHLHLDIEEMSYEELLTLGERIGNVKTRLSEKIITRKLKTRSYSTLEEAAPVEQEPDLCTICQEDYKNQEKIGTLDCGHEYHASCLRKWLLVKNVCPICKSEALAT